MSTEQNKVYSLNELSEDAQRVAFNEYNCNRQYDLPFEQFQFESEINNWRYDSDGEFIGCANELEL